VFNLPQLFKATSYLPAKLSSLFLPRSAQYLFLLAIHNILITHPTSLGSWHTMKWILKSAGREQIASKTRSVKKPSPSCTERASDAKRPKNNATARRFAIAALGSALRAFGLALLAS
jgi:hypothetical protein